MKDKKLRMKIIDELVENQGRALEWLKLHDTYISFVTSRIDKLEKELKELKK